MKRLLLLCAVLIGIFALNACSEKPANSLIAGKAPTKPSPDATAVQPAALPPMSHFDQALRSKLSGVAFGGVDYVNGNLLPRLEEPVDIDGNVIAISGNVIDRERKEAANWVLRVVGSQSLPASTRSDRPGVGKVHGSERYPYS
jgi:hypothetical protein